jgi:restriction system protein
MEKIVEKPVNKLPSEKYYIWSKDQVKDYIKEKTAFIWFLRVNKLRDPYWAEPTVGPIIFANLKDEVSLDGMEPVLNDSEFAKSTDNIK